MKSINDIDSKLNNIQNNLATTAKNNDKINVKTKDEIILSSNCSENSNFGDIIPICKLVDNLEANEITNDYFKQAIDKVKPGKTQEEELIQYM